jgi:hypothetical protein
MRTCGDLTQVAARLNSPTGAGSFRGRWAFPFLVGAVFTVLNAFKPLQVDDTAYEYFARQMAVKPLDPYGFEVFWYEQPEPANEILAPPVFCYTWAAVHHFTDTPVIWKLALLPWSLLLVFGLRGLLRRFARHLETPLLVMFVFSPALLPSLNLMLDVPALALSVAALNVYFQAADRDSLALAAWAGLLAGVAMQTKYTAFPVLGVMLVWSATTGRWRLWPAAVLVGIPVFVSWEFVVAVLYGRSHFLLALSGGDLLAKLGHLPFLTSQLGGLIPFGVALGLAALGVARRWVWAAVAVMLAGFVAVALFDVVIDSSVDLLGRAVKEPIKFQLAEIVFNCYGLAGVAVVVLVAWRLLRMERAVGDKHTLFLVLWLGIEVLGFVALTPFPAVRRVLGVGLVGALLVGRLAARRAHLMWRRGLVPGLTAGSVLLALGYWALDWHGAWVQQHLAESAAQYAADRGGGRVWYVGHWGFQFYAERSDMRPVVPGETTLVPGDWLVLPERRLEQQKLAVPEDRLDLHQELTVVGRLPLRTVPCFYGGRTPLEHQEGACLGARIYRVRIGFEATAGTPLAFQFGR